MGGEHTREDAGAFGHGEHGAMAQAAADRPRVVAAAKIVDTVLTRMDEAARLHARSLVLQAWVAALMHRSGGTGIVSSDEVKRLELAEQAIMGG